MILAAMSLLVQCWVSLSFQICVLFSVLFLLKKFLETRYFTFNLTEKARLNLQLPETTLAKGAIAVLSFAFEQMERGKLKMKWSLHQRMVGVIPGRVAEEIFCLYKNESQFEAYVINLKKSASIKEEIPDFWNSPFIGSDFELRKIDDEGRRYLMGKIKEGTNEWLQSFLVPLIDIGFYKGFIDRSRLLQCLGQCRVAAKPLDTDKIMYERMRDRAGGKK